MVTEFVVTELPFAIPKTAPEIPPEKPPLVPEEWKLPLLLLGGGAAVLIIGLAVSRKK